LQSKGDVDDIAEENGIDGYGKLTPLFDLKKGLKKG
jgi:hypothetical protein